MPICFPLHSLCMEHLAQIVYGTFSTNEGHNVSMTTHDHQFSSPLSQKSMWAELGFLMQMQQVWKPSVRKAVFLSRASREETVSRLIQVVGRILFLVVVGLKVSFRRWLSIKLWSPPSSCLHSFHALHRAWYSNSRRSPSHTS